MKSSLIIFFALSILSFKSLAKDVNTPIENQGDHVRSDFIVPTTTSTAFPFSGSEITMPSGQRLRYYTSDTSTQKKPLVLFVPGSGCTGAFASLPDGHRTMGPETFALEFEKRARLVVVENPGIEERFARETDSGCSSTFKEMANMQARLEALQTIVADLRRRGWIDHQPFMIVASSEGVSIATRFAALSKNVSHLLLISGFGIGHTLATIHTALTGSGDYWGFIPAPESNDPLSRLQSTLARWEQMRRDQGHKSSETTAGYQAAYWRTIGLASSAEDALASNAQLYLVQGGRDQNAPAVNYGAGIAYLVTHDRSFVSEYIPCGDHFLICPDDGEEPKNLQGVIVRGMEWFLTAQVKRASAVSFDPLATLK
jgi:hypothetical protein